MNRLSCNVQYLAELVIYREALGPRTILVELYVRSEVGELRFTPRFVTVSPA